MLENVCAAIEKASRKKDVKIIANFPYDDFNKLEVRYLGSFNKFIITNLFWKSWDGDICCPMIEILVVGKYVVPVPVLIGNVSLKGYSSGKVGMFLEKNRYIPDEYEIESAIWNENPI